MDVFLMIRRHKTTIFLDAKENNTVLELKKMIEGILKYKPEDQQLFKDEEVGNLKSRFYLYLIIGCSPLASWIHLSEWFRFFNWVPWSLVLLYIYIIRVTLNTESDPFSL